MQGPKTKGIILIVFLFLIIISCRKEETADTLPPVHVSDTIQVGASAFADDTVWLASSWEAIVKNGFLDISIKNDTGEIIGFWIYGAKPGLFILNNNTPHLAYYKDLKGNIYFSSSVASKSNSIFAGGMISISVMTTDTVSGSFNLNLYCPETNKYKIISQGTFNNLKFENYSSGNGVNVDGINTLPFTTNSDTTRAAARIYDNTFVVLNFKNQDQIEICLPSFAKGSYPVSFSTKSNISFYPKNSRTIYSSLGSEYSWGNIIVTDTANSLISGIFSAKIYNPADKKFVIYHSGSFKKIKLTKMKKEFSQKNLIECNIDNSNYTNTYAIVNEFNDYLKITSFDNQFKPRIIFYFPVGTGTGLVTLSKEKKDSYTIYLNEKGKMFNSTDGEIVVTTINKLQNDTLIKVMDGNFHFNAQYGNNEANSSIKDGHFKIYYW